jgi:hypothetical protein
MNTKKGLMIATLILLAGSLQTSVFAAQRRWSGMGSGNSGRGEFHEGFRGGYRYGDFGRAYGTPIYVEPWSGWYGGWYAPWAGWPGYYPEPNVVEVRHIDYGTLEFKVKPEDTQIYIDKKLIGTVKSLDHQKIYVKQGDHEITLKSSGGRTVERNVYVPVGKKIKINEML